MQVKNLWTASVKTHYHAYSPYVIIYLQYLVPIIYSILLYTPYKPAELTC